MQKTHLYKRCLRALVLVLVLMLPLVSIASAETLMVIKGGSLNLRQEASLDSKSLGQYPSGTWVTVVEGGDTWSKVKVNGNSGYMMSKYLSDGSSSDTLYVRTNSTKGLNLRTQPSLTGDIMGSFKTGTAVSDITRGNGWHKVQVGGMTGYMSSSFLSGSASGGGGGNGGGNTGSSKQGTVNNPGANQVLLLREKASTDARVLGYFKNGTTVKITGESGNFYKVTVGGMNGYMMKKYIKVGSSSTGGGSSTLPEAPFTAKLVNPNGNGIVNFRKGAGLNSSIIKAYPVGTEITVTKTGDVWCKATIDGVEGYVSRYFFKVVK